MNRPISRIRNVRSAQYGVLLCLTTILLAPSQAATMSFNLSDSNRVLVVADYLSATRIENSLGNLDTLAHALDPLNNSLHTNHVGVQTFSSDLNELGMDNDASLSDGWEAMNHRHGDDLTESGTKLVSNADARSDMLPLTFNGADIDDSSQIFENKVTRLDSRSGSSPAFYIGDNDSNESNISEASDTNKVDPSPVPLPLSVWLFISGLLALLGSGMRQGKSLRS
ncbi:MAG: hypothetical protein ACYC9J_12535 [Sulfuricaulis sp.]